jgi:site-specific DNA-methyltransferase (adenine-specific)
MNIETQMFCGDSAQELLNIKDNSVDMLCTDPPYGYSFMNKGWDKVLPDVNIWRQCYRVLKPGSFITVMAAPRTDVLWRISRDLEEAGFDLSFSNIEWVYHSGFPKATDVSKMIDKREGGEVKVGKSFNVAGGVDNQPLAPTNPDRLAMKHNADTELAKKYEGSKAGFQPKPAREIIIVAMKPFEEGSYIDKVLNFEALPDNVKMTYPLIQTPKPAKKEKNYGLSEGKSSSHPTVKPIKLMSYLITLFTRPGDWVLDPFGGSGTTGLACKLLDRNHIYVDFTQEYYHIAEERFNVTKQELKKLLKEKISNGQLDLF